MDVFLIEDNPGDARLVREMLRDSGTNLLGTAESLAEGFRFLDTHPVDALLLDANLPDASGLEAVEKTVARFPSLPVIVLTSADDQEMALNAVKSGAEDYLIKGKTDADLLYRSVEYAVERKRAEEAVLHAKQEWEKTFDSMPDLVAILDMHHHILRVNKAMASHMGMAPQQCVGMFCFKCVHGWMPRPISAPTPAPCGTARSTSPSSTRNTWEATS